MRESYINMQPQFPPFAVGRIHRMSPKKLGLVFRAHFSILASNKKVKENKLNLEFNFTYWKVFYSSAAALL